MTQLSLALFISIYIIIFCFKFVQGYNPSIICLSSDSFRIVISILSHNITKQ